MKMCRYANEGGSSAHLQIFIFAHFVPLPGSPHFEGARNRVRSGAASKEGIAGERTGYKLAYISILGNDYV